MTFIKYLGRCIVDLIDFFNPPTTAFWREIIIGLITLLVIVATFILSFIFLNWYFALIITIGGVVTFCLFSIIIECFVNCAGVNFMF